MEALSVWIAKHRLKQAEAGDSDAARACPTWVKKNTAKFTIDKLVEMLSRVGKPVRLAIS